MTTAKQKRAQRRKEELQRRRELKAYLIEKHGAVCMACGVWHPYLLDLSHIVSLGRGGKTELDNLEVLCRRCHQIRHHQIKEG